MKYTKVHRVFRLKQEAIFSDFIQNNTSLRKDAKSPFEKDLFNFMSNSIYEKLLYNARKINYIETKLITDSKRLIELNSNPCFKKCYPIDDNKLIVKLPFDKYKFEYPLFVGWYILKLSKIYMYNLYYNVLKENYEKDGDLV